VKNVSEEVEKDHKKLIVGAIVVVVVVIVLFIPMIPVSVAYNETESYNRDATYVVDDYNLQEKLGWFDFYVQSDVTVRNTDEYGGTFALVLVGILVYG